MECFFRRKYILCPSVFVFTVTTVPFFSTQWVRILCLERAVTMLYKYYCLETFGLGMFCILSCFYFCPSVNGVLLPVSAPIGSSVKAFLILPLTPSPVKGLDLWHSAMSHRVLMGLTASPHTYPPPWHSQTHTHRNWTELWTHNPDEYFLSASAFLFATNIVFCMCLD